MNVSDLTNAEDVEFEAVDENTESETEVVKRDGETEGGAGARGAPGARAAAAVEDDGVAEDDDEELGELLKLNSRGIQQKLVGKDDDGSVDYEALVDRWIYKTDELGSLRAAQGAAQGATGCSEPQHGIHSIRNGQIIAFSKRMVEEAEQELRDLKRLRVDPGAIPLVQESISLGDLSRLGLEGVVKKNTDSTNITKEEIHSSLMKDIIDGEDLAETDRIRHRIQAFDEKYKKLLLESSKDELKPDDELEDDYDKLLRRKQWSMEITKLLVDQLVAKEQERKQIWLKKEKLLQVAISNEIPESSMYLP